MLSLETIGYYTDEPNTQQYPAPLGLLYPSTGNFIGMVGEPPVAPAAHPRGNGLPCGDRVSHPVSRRARLAARVSAGPITGPYWQEGLSRHHADRHRPVSVSPLPYGARYA